MVVSTRRPRQNNPTFVLRISLDRIYGSTRNHFFSDPVSVQRGKREEVVGHFRVKVVRDSPDLEAVRRPADAQVHDAIRIRR